MSDITAKAIAAIGEDQPDYDWVLKPEEHARKLPPEAGALKRILASTTTTREAYRAHDARTIWAQARYKRAGGLALVSGLIAILIGAAFLMPITQSIPTAVRQTATIVEYFMLFIAFIAARYLSRSRPFETWMSERAQAEVSRVQMFNDVMQHPASAEGGELPSLPLKLEYFRRYQMDVQRRYYLGRGNQHARAAGHTKFWEICSLLLGLLAGFVALLAALPVVDIVFPGATASLGPIATLGAILHADDNRWLALGVAASALYGHSVSRSYMNLDERNASRYLTTFENLDLLSREELPAARQHAAEGNEKAVSDFVERVQALISSEHQEWIKWRKLAPQPHVRAVYLVLPKQGT